MANPPGAAGPSNQPRGYTFSLNKKQFFIVRKKPEVPSPEHIQLRETNVMFELPEDPGDVMYFHKVTDLYLLSKSSSAKKKIGNHIVAERITQVVIPDDQMGFLKPFTPDYYQKTGISITYKIRDDQTFDLQFSLHKKSVFDSIEHAEPKLEDIYRQKRVILFRMLCEVAGSHNDVDYSNLPTPVTSEVNLERLIQWIDWDKKSDSNRRLVQLLADQDLVGWMIYREECGCQEEPFVLRPYTNRDNIVLKGYYLYRDLGVMTKSVKKWDSNDSFLRQFAVSGGIVVVKSGANEMATINELILKKPKNPKEKNGDVAWVYNQKYEMKKAEREYYEKQGARSKNANLIFSASKKSKNIVKCEGSCTEMCDADVCNWTISKDEEFKFVCPACIREQPKRALGTTLIVIREETIDEWFNGIAANFSETFNIMFYFGLRKSRYIQPNQMDKFDIVITTYSALASDVDFCASRRGSKIQTLVSPLVSVKFWRLIAMDTHLLFTTPCKATIVLHEIEADNLWAFVGYPKTLQLLPTFQLLGLQPFCDKGYLETFAIPQYLAQDASQTIENASHQLCPVMVSILAHIMWWKEPEIKVLKEPETKLVEIRFSFYEDLQFRNELKVAKKPISAILGNHSATKKIAELPDYDKLVTIFSQIQELTLIGGIVGRSTQEHEVSNYVFNHKNVRNQLICLQKVKIAKTLNRYLLTQIGAAAAFYADGNNREVLNFCAEAKLSIEKVLRKDKHICETLNGTWTESIRLLNLFQSRFPLDDGQVTVNLRNGKEFLMQVERLCAQSVVKTTSKALCPPCKKRKLTAGRKKETLQMEIAMDMDDEEKEKEAARLHSQELAELVFKPTKLHADLVLTLTSAYGQVIDVDGFDVAFVVRDHLIMQINCCRATITQVFIWDNPKLVAAMKDFFKEWKDRLEENNDKNFEKKWSTHFVDATNHSPVKFVKDRLIPFLPQSFLYGDDAIPIDIPHDPKTCMGECLYCTDSECCYPGSNRVLPLRDILQKLEDLLIKLPSVGKYLDGMITEVFNMLELATDYRDASYFLHFDESKHRELSNVLACNHDWILEYESTKSDIIAKTEESTCQLCKIQSEVCLFRFLLGYQTFHGEIRSRSGVQALLKHLVTHLHYNTTRATEFEREVFDRYFKLLNKGIEVLFLKVKSCTQLFKELWTLRIFRSTPEGKGLSDHMRDAAQLRDIIVSDQVKSLVREPHQKYLQYHLNDASDAKAEFEEAIGEINYLLNPFDEDRECHICYGNLKEVPTTLTGLCGHPMCSDCWERSKNPKTGHSCPKCRKALKVDETVMINFGQNSNSVVEGMQLSSKMSEAIKKIREILAQDPSNKIIVVTNIDASSPKAWRYLEKVFTRAEIPFLAMVEHNAKQAAVFADSNEKKVFLCSIGVFSKYKNFTTANHMLFLDPPSNRHSLDQAINFMKRPGQTRPIEVHHLVVTNSLDEELMKLVEGQKEETEEYNWTCKDIRKTFGIPEPQI